MAHQASQPRTRAQHKAARLHGRKRRRPSPIPLLLATMVALVAAASLATSLIQSPRQESSRAPLNPKPLVAGCEQLADELADDLLSNGTVSEGLAIGAKIGALSVEQQVAQLFVVTPESLVAHYTDDTVTAAGEGTRQALQERPVGGIVYFKQNLVDPQQTAEMLANAAAFGYEACGIPLLLDVDEEGGTVSRIGGNEGFGIANVGNMCDVGSAGDPSYARDVASWIGTYLHDLGFTADFAPVADVADNPDSDTMRWRSFGDDPALVAQMVAAQVEGFRSAGIICAAKHFPGIGAAEGDSHAGAIYTHKTAEQLQESELVPFAAAIEAGVPMVMVGHISCPEVTGDDLPASLSPAVMGGLLRDTLGFDGVVITDSLGMGAVVERAGAGRVAVEAFKAGADCLLMPPDFDAAYQGMLEAVQSGEISQQRLSASLYRIIRMKLAYAEGASS